MHRLVLQFISWRIMIHQSNTSHHKLGVIQREVHNGTINYAELSASYPAQNIRSPWYLILYSKNIRIKLPWRHVVSFSLAVWIWRLRLKLRNDIVTIVCPASYRSIQKSTAILKFAFYFSLRSCFIVSQEHDSSLCFSMGNFFRHKVDVLLSTCSDAIKHCSIWLSGFLS